MSRKIHRRLLWNIIVSAVLLFILFGFTPRTEQSAAAHIYSAATDSSLFTPNAAEGWSSMQSYVHLSGDSVEFEVLFARDVPIGTDWTKTAFAGTIDSAYAPKTRIELRYKQPTITWSVIIWPNGQCYLRWIGGDQPASDRLILPLFTKYRK
jgi:hypothetical protein